MVHLLVLLRFVNTNFARQNPTTIPVQQQLPPEVVETIYDYIGICWGHVGNIQGHVRVTSGAEQEVVWPGPEKVIPPALCVHLGFRV